MTGSGRKPDSYDAHMELNRRFIRRENTFRLLLLLLRQQAAKRGDTATVSLINSVIQRANEGDPIKMDLLAMMAETENG